MLMLKLVPEIFTYIKIFNNYLNKKIDYRGINTMKKSIKNGIKIYQEYPFTDRKKIIIDNSNKVIKA